MGSRGRTMAGALAAALGALALGVLPAAARAGEPVDLALVLVADVSRSIDEDEFALQKKGYSAAFADPRVITAIRAGKRGAIAVSYVEFAAEDEVKTVVDWTVIRDGESASLFAEALQNAPRAFEGFTSISAGIDFAVKRLAALGPAGRRVIDVSGDGTNNSGRDVTAARDDAVKLGITINGLTIINPRPSPFGPSHIEPEGGLTEYYRRNVIGGSRSFVLEVRDFASFGEALARKLVTEIGKDIADAGATARRF